MADEVIWPKWSMDEKGEMRSWDEQGCGREGRWRVGRGRRSPLPPPLAPQPGCPVQSPAQQQVWRQQGAPLLSALWVGPVQIQPLIVCFRVRGKRFNMWVDNITGYWTIKTFFIILWATSFMKSVLEKKPHIWHQEPLTGKSRNELLISLFFSIIKHCHFPWSQTKTYHFGYYSFYLLAALWCLQEILKWYFLPSRRERGDPKSSLRSWKEVSRKSSEAQGSGTFWLWYALHFKWPQIEGSLQYLDQNAFICMTRSPWSHRPTHLAGRSRPSYLASSHHNHRCFAALYIPVQCLVPLSPAPQTNS